MTKTRKALMVGAVFALAFATGYIMQNSSDVAARLAGSDAEQALAVGVPGPLEAES